MKKQIDRLLDELLDSFMIHEYEREDPGFLGVKKNIVDAIYSVATTAQRAGGEATRGVTSEIKARSSAENGKKGGRPAKAYTMYVLSEMKELSCEKTPCGEFAIFGVEDEIGAVRNLCRKHLPASLRGACDRLKELESKISR